MENLGGMPGAILMFAQKLNCDRGIKSELKRCCALPKQTRDQDLVLLARRLQEQVQILIDCGDLFASLPKHMRKS